jgi:DNA-binding MarR family transcriptional regulator
VKQLESLGYVARQADDADRRASVLTLTASGRRVLGKIPAARRDLVSGLLDTFTPDERTTLARLLDRLADNIVRATS